jgi:DNA-directed RNA polymerase subunit RPC12/RpoP
MYSTAMNTLPPVYRCRECGAASYQKLTHRGPDGAMRYSGLYRCSGCPFTFSDPSEWRERRLRARRQNGTEPMDALPGADAEPSSHGSLPIAS